MSARTTKIACRYALMAALLAFPIVPVFSQDLGRFFDSNGVLIHYIDVGEREGDPVVLMHGLNGSLERWIDTGFVEALTEAGFRVLALDARAHGKSGTPHDPAKYGQEMSLDIARLLDHVGIEKAHIVGYSMGARIVGKLRDLKPERFLSMCIGGRGWVQEEGPEPRQIFLAESLERGQGFIPLYERYYPDWSDADREARSKRMLETIPDPLATAAMLRGVDSAVSEESVRTNTVPTLAIIGSKDPNKPSVDALDGVMPNLEIVVIPDADHVEAFVRPEHLENLLRFLKEHSTRSVQQDSHAYL